MEELVSIIMPSFNTCKYIANSIESVINQTYTNWELLIVDDCSQDNTDEVVKRYLEDPRIRYLKNEKNCGAAVSRNRALKVAKGKWIAFLDSDDLWLSEKLEKQVKFMKEAGYNFSYTKYEEMNADGVNIGITVGGPFKITRRKMFNYCWPGCLTVMYNKEVVGDIQIADIRKNNDYAMWLKVCKIAECYLLDDVLAKYRRGRTGSVSTQSIMTLIKWHYLLFREAENQNVLLSILNTCRNVFFGYIKKRKYVFKN